MKVLQVNSVYKIGSTGKIVHDLHILYRKKGIDSYVIYGRGTSSDEISKDDHVLRICSDLYARANTARAILTGLPYGGCEIATQRLIRAIRKIHPDIVHLQCINEHFINIYKILDWLGKNTIPTVVTLHAEFMFTANCGHADNCMKWLKECGNCPNLRAATRSIFWDRTTDSCRRMKKAFSYFGDNLYIVSVSPWLGKRAQQSPILRKKRHEVIMNGVDTNVFYRRKEFFYVNKEKYKNYQKIVFHATAMFRDRKEDPKGGWYIIRLAERLKKDGILFIVAGNYEIREKMPDNIILLGIVSNQNEMAEYYSYADLTVITSKRETFSMVCAESLCCGTPVAGFEAGGPETIALPEYSSFVQFGDLDALVQCVKEMLGSSNVVGQYDPEQIAKEAKEQYDRERMAAGYLEIYERLMREHVTR